jgi:LPXTG-motif cell wall-anchored protein
MKFELHNLLIFTILFYSGMAHTQPFGNSLNLNGINDYVVIPDNELIDFSDSISIEVWVKPEDTSNHLILHKGQCPNNFGYYLDIFEGRISFGWLQGSCSETPINRYMTDSIVMFPHVFAHLAVIFGPDQIKIFINGILASGSLISGKHVPCVNTTEPLRIGAYMNGEGIVQNNFIGELDEFRIWNYQLSSEEVSNRMNAPLKGNELGLLAYYDMNELNELSDIMTLINKSIHSGRVLNGLFISDEEGFFSRNFPEYTSRELQYEYEKLLMIEVVENEKKAALVKADVEKQILLRNYTIVVAGILVLSSLLLFLFYKRKRDAEQKQKETFLSLQVSETEMKALRSQMNPHFIFNALQSIQTFLLSHKSEEANLYLLKFSKLMRAVLENSQYSEVPLKSDLQALELYMQLESIRLRHPFTYEFHIDKTVDIDSDFLPPLILQPFVENAIWHGLQHKSGAGHIDIFIAKQSNALHATVVDNGVGRNMSRQVAQPMLLKKESLGMKLTEERLKILNEVKNFKAHFKIIDLFTKDNQPSGTRVELSLPLVA